MEPSPLLIWLLGVNAVIALIVSGPVFLIGVLLSKESMAKEAAIAMDKCTLVVCLVSLYCEIRDIRGAALKTAFWVNWYINLWHVISVGVVCLVSGNDEIYNR